MGEYVEVDPPRRSVLRLVDGVGMPFSDYRQTIEVAGDGGRTAVTLRLEYAVRGPLVLIERFTVRGQARPGAARLGPEGRDAVRVIQPEPSSVPYALR